MLICITGGLGSGKTLGMTAWACKFSCMGGMLPIISNYKIEVDGHIDTILLQDEEDMIRMIKLVKREKGILLIDEAYKFLDSRLSMNKRNVYLSQFFMFLRKLNLITIVTIQSFRMIDIRVREIIDVLIVCRKINKGFEQRIFDYQLGKQVKRLCLREEVMKEVYEMYDTFEMVKEFKFPEREEEFNKFMDRLQRERG